MSRILLSINLNFGCGSPSHLIALHSHDSSLFHSIAWYSLNKIYPWKTVYPWPSHWCHFSPHSHCSDSVKRLKRSKGRWLYKILKLPKKAVAFFNVFVWHPKRSGNVVNPIINPQFHRGWWKCNPFLWWFWGWLAFAAWPLCPFRAALIRGSTLALKNAPSEAQATTHNSDRTCHWGLKN